MGINIDKLARLQLKTCTKESKTYSKNNDAEVLKDNAIEILKLLGYSYIKNDTFDVKASSEVVENEYVLYKEQKGELYRQSESGSEVGEVFMTCFENRYLHSKKYCICIRDEDDTFSCDYDKGISSKSRNSRLIDYVLTCVDKSYKIRYSRELLKEIEICGYRKGSGSFKIQGDNYKVIARRSYNSVFIDFVTEYDYNYDYSVLTATFPASKLGCEVIRAYTNLLLRQIRLNQALG